MEGFFNARDQMKAPLGDRKSVEEEESEECAVLAMAQRWLLWMGNQEPQDVGSLLLP